MINNSSKKLNSMIMKAIKCFFQSQSIRNHKETQYKARIWANCSIKLDQTNLCLLVKNTYFQI